MSQSLLRICGNLSKWQPAKWRTDDVWQVHSLSCCELAAPICLVLWQLSCVALLFISGSVFAEELSYVDLVNRMTDLEGLATLPVTGESCAMWSSNDRASSFNEQAGKYEKWFANGDGNGLIRMEGDSQVIAEMDGPGVIWRIWSAKPEAGHVKVFLDGELAIDMPFAHYFDSQHAPFRLRHFGLRSCAQARTCTFPFPIKNLARSSRKRAGDDTTRLRIPLFQTLRSCPNSTRLWRQPASLRCAT